MDFNVGRLHHASSVLGKPKCTSFLHLSFSLPCFNSREFPSKVKTCQIRFGRVFPYLISLDGRCTLNRGY